MPSVKDIMTKPVIAASPESTVEEAAEIMASKGVGCLIITQAELPVGIITERDLVRRIIAKKLPYSTKVSEVMTSKLITVDPEMPLKAAARLMSTSKVRRLPVVHQDRLVGIIVASDFVRSLGKKTTAEEILEAISRCPAGGTPFVGAPFFG